MTTEPSSSQADPAGDWVDWRFLLPLLAHVLTCQLAVQLMRVATTYRALELSVSVFWIGVIAACFAVLPMFAALPVGRFIDRRGGVMGLEIGTALMLAAGLGLYLWPATSLHLALYNVLIGLGSMFCIASHQTLQVRGAGLKARDRVFGNYVFSASLGQAAGPILLIWLAGGGAIPETGHLFLSCLICTLAMVAAVLAIPREEEAEAGSRSSTEVPISQILGTHGMLASYFASVLTTTAMDLLIVYLPVLGHERAIAASTVGWLLTARAVASMSSRFFYAQLIALFGRREMTIASMLMSAGGLVVIALPVPVWIMFAGMLLAGFGIGLATALTLAEVIALAPAGGRATALSLRMLGNRAGQLVLPLAAGAIATATGTGGVMALTGLALAGVGVAIARRKDSG